MDLLDRLLGHDAWTTRRLIVLSRTLADAALDREFDLGHRTLRRTLDHVVENVELWTDLMNGWNVRPSRSASTDPDGLLERFERAHGEFSGLARRLRAEGRLDDLWVDVLDDPPAEKTYGGAIAHLVTHSMHHRAQAIHMLRRLGVENVPEGDALSWERAATMSPRATKGAP